MLAKGMGTPPFCACGRLVRQRTFRAYVHFVAAAFFLEKLRRFFVCAQVGGRRLLSKMGAKLRKVQRRARKRAEKSAACALLFSDVRRFFVGERDYFCVFLVKN